MTERPDGRLGAPTIYDVAREAGVSIATVSRAINGSSGLRPGTRDRVLAAVEALGYAPDSSARSLSSGLHETIGFLLVDRAHEPLLGPDQRMLEEEHEDGLFQHDVIRGALRCALHEGYKLLIGYVDSRSSTETAKEMLGSADGLVIVDRAVSEECLAWLSQRKAVVALAWEQPIAEETVLRIDNRKAMTELVAHLVGAHGHRELGIIAGPPSSPDAADRLVAAHEAARVQGVGVLDMGRGDYSAGSGADLVRTFLERGRELPSAVVCINDQMALGVLGALEAEGISVPGRCAVTGFDDIVVSRFLRPALTTVRQPSEELGSLAITTILEIVHGGRRTGREIVLSTELVVRESCGCLSERSRSALR